MLEQDINGTVFDIHCPKPDKCDPTAKYRTFDGSCNNLNQPKFGWVHTPYQRILPNAYHDGIEEIRKEEFGKELRGPRNITLTLEKFSRKSVSSKISSAMTAFGQFVDHDLTKTPTFKAEDGGFLKCCENFPLPKGDVLHSRCASIAISENDPFFSEKNGCMPFTRSQRSLRLDCKPGPSEQQNQITHWLDLSQVYGNSAEEEVKIRSAGRTGKSQGRGQIHLATDLTKETLGASTDNFKRVCIEEGCFLSGKPFRAIFLYDTLKTFVSKATAESTRTLNWLSTTPFSQSFIIA